MTTESAVAREAPGFTLIEVLVSSVVMLIGVFGILAAFPQADRTTKDSGRLSVVDHLAAEKVDDLLSLPYTDADLTSGTHPAQSIDSSGARYYAVAGFPEDYSLRWIVTDNSPIANMKTIVIESTYRMRYTLLGVPQPVYRTLLATFRTSVARTP